MADRYSGSRRTEEIEGLQYSLGTGTHLISLVEKEEVRMFDCFFFFSVIYNMNSIYVPLNLFVFNLEGYNLNTRGYWKNERGRIYF